MKLKQEYTIVFTKDGSPTLRLKTQSHEESMHSHGGAFGETIYIYTEPFKSIEPCDKLSVLSVGLGLGYNELASVCEFLTNKKHKQFYLESYEKDEFLIQQFKRWLNNEPTALAQIYDQILNLFSEHYNLSITQIKSKTLDLYLSGDILLKKSIGYTTQFKQKFNIVLYDAFCSRTSPGLWSDDLLQYVIDQIQLKNSYFTTYACKSSLSKLLRENSFNLEKKSGFAGKRESTLATR